MTVKIEMPDYCMDCSFMSLETSIEEHIDVDGNKYYIRQEHTCANKDFCE